MRQIASYQIVKLITESEHSVIYQGVDPQGDKVVIKLLNYDFPSSAKLVQFRKEYENTQLLDGVTGVLHPIELIKYQHTLAIVYEFFSTTTLGQFIEQLQHFSPREAIEKGLKIATQLAAILQQVHEHNIIHKDINPSNILIDPKSLLVKYIDFGISSLLSQERHGFQNSSQLEGTLEFISPEQTGRLNKSLDLRSDLYSLGASLYQLFTGNMLFNGLQGIELVHAQIAQMPITPQLLNQALPSAIAAVLMRCLEKMPDDRYQSAAGLYHDLDTCLQQWLAHGDVEEFSLASQDFPTTLNLPQKLYGREQQCAEILDAFQQSRQGNSHLLLVAGASGTGKSTLVHELHKPITAERGCFISGKFEQYQQDIPFYAWTQALNSFINYLMKEPSDTLAYWQKLLQQALGNIGQVVVDLVPALRLLIGEQVPVPELAGEQARNRFKYAFGEFFKAVCQPEHPLVIFLDDWQWADPASIKLLDYLLKDSQLKHLLVIAAYRDNEVDSASSFMITLEQLRLQRLNISQINLGNLAQNDVHQLLQDTLKQSEVDDLSALVCEKTQGNAFFVNQFLRQIYQSNLLSFDREIRCWQWHTQAIIKQAVTDNVVQLLEQQIRQLPQATQDCLKIAACIGNRFQLDLLSLLLNKERKQTIEALEPAIAAGVVLPLNHNYRFGLYSEHQEDMAFSFVHDKVQQSSYGLIAPDDLAATHFKIGKTMLAGLEQEEQQSSCFDLVQHFNMSKSLLTEEQDLHTYIRLNYQAGVKAKSTTAYTPALHYFSNAIDCLPHDHWYRDHQFSAQLLVEAADAALLSNQYQQMEAWCDDLLQHLNNAIEKIQVHQIRLRAYTAQNRLAEAVTQALTALALAGVKLPSNPKEIDVLLKAMHTKLVMKGKTFSQLSALPKVDDPTQLKAMELLGLTIPPAYWTNPNLVFLVVFQIARDTLKHGYSPMAGFGYSWWGITECAVLGNIDLGYQYGKFGIEFAKDKGLALHQSLFYFGWIIKPYKHHLRESIPELIEAYKLALEKGDFEYASYSLNNQMQYLFHCGDELKQLTNNMRKAHQSLEKFQLGSSLYWHDIWWQTALNMIHGGAEPYVLEGEGYKEQELLPVHQQANDVSTLFLLYCAKLQLSVVFQHWSQAAEFERQARALLKAGVGMFAAKLFHYYSSLSLIEQARQLSGRQRKKRLKLVRANLQQIKKWADSAPMNHQHRYMLVQAELHALGEDWLKAGDCYEQALELANQNQFIQDEALAYELCAMFYKRRGNSRLHQFYLQQAHHLYQQWGASAKVRQLEIPDVESHSQMRGTLSLRNSTYRSTQFSSGDVLDVGSIVKASQAISSEIVLEQLIKTLLKTMLENAGAEKGVLFFGYAQDKLEPVAAAQVAQEQFSFIEIGADIGQLDYPHSLVNFVRNKGEQVILADAHQDPRFAEDPYINKQQCKSVMCYPIAHQGKMVAMLYLENNLLKGVFNPDRLQLINMLSSQAAISLINANHYATLEQEVKQRTAEISDKNKQLQLATQAKSEFLAKMSHEIRTPMNAVIGLSRLTLKTQLNNQQKDYIEKVIDAGESLLSLINDILDFSKIEAGKLSIEATPFKLDKVLHQAVSLSALNAHAKGLELVTDLQEGTPTQVIGDPLRLQQVVVNLVNNAVKFTEKGAICIRVQVREQAEHDVMLQFSIIDTGIGMSHEQISRLFQSFSQGDESVTRRYGGTGLGLAIAKQLCELMHGEIWVESELNKGSSFHFTVRLQKAIYANEHKPLINHSVANLRALVVDDIAIARTVMLALLKRLNIDCDEAESGEQALEMVANAKQEQRPYDLVLMDWRMPNMDGIETSRRMHQQLQDESPHILMVSSYDKDEAKELARYQGTTVNQFIDKPVSISKLLDAINEIQHRKQGLQQAQAVTAEIPKLSGYKVLLVEDNAINRQVALGFLGDTLVEVDVAENGVTALQKIQQNNYHLVLMDIQMPEMDGYTATHKIRNSLGLKDLPIIAMTAEALASDVKKALEHGMNAHISKPIEPEILYRTLAKYLHADTRQQAAEEKLIIFKPSSKDAQQQQALIGRISHIKKLDCQLAITKLSGKQSLYLSLIRDFYRGQQEAAEQLNRLYRQEDWHELYRKIHSLKSMSAYIGAYQLSKLCEQVEAHINAGKFGQIDLEPVCQMLQDLIEDLGELELDAKGQVSKIDFSEQKLKASLHQILPMLEASDFAVEEYLQPLQLMCTDTEYSPHVEDIIKNVDDFEHERAARIANSLLARLGGIGD